jgi:hypothetical protein
MMHTKKERKKRKKKHTGKKKKENSKIRGERNLLCPWFYIFPCSIKSPTFYSSPT